MYQNQFAGADVAEGDETMGEELAGADEMMGAMEIGAQLPHPKLRMRRPQDGRRLPLGVVSSNPASIPPGLSQDITSRPQVLFRLERFIVPSDIAALFVIDNITVGTNSVFAATGPVPARVFDEQATNVLLGTDTNMPATDLTTKVTNISLAPAVFRAAYIGIAVK
jgi:hypothetical protein